MNVLKAGTKQFVFVREFECEKCKATLKIETSDLHVIPASYIGVRNGAATVVESIDIYAICSMCLNPIKVSSSDRP